MDKKTKVTTTKSPVSVRAFADIMGVDPGTIRKAIKSGRLVESIVEVGGKPKISDPDLAAEELRANTRGKSDSRFSMHVDLENGDDHGGEEPGDDGISFNEARRRREIETWKLSRVKRRTEELALSERQGELITVAEARATVLDEYTSLKTKLLGLPTRIRQRVQKLTTEDVLIINDLVREALESLSNGE